MALELLIAADFLDCKHLCIMAKLPSLKTLLAPILDWNRVQSGVYVGITEWKLYVNTNDATDIACRSPLLHFDTRRI